MASNEWNKIDKEIHGFENHVCAFLDILGYKEKSKQFFDGKLNLYGRINRALIQAGVELNKEGSPDGIFTQIFSDSIIVYSNLKKINILLNYVASLVAFFSYEELFLRGGISIGRYIDKFERTNNFSFFSSEALIKAYNMETQAIFPLIEIDKVLISKIIPQNDMFLKFESKYILNFARYVINEFGQNQAQVIDELNDIKILLEEAVSPKIAEKIEWIMNYYLWFIEKSHIEHNSFEITKFEIFNQYKNPKLTFT